MKTVRTPVRTHQFTLLEMLIALIIFAMIATVLFASGNAVTQSWLQLNEVEARFQEVMEIERVVESTFSHAIPFNWRDEDRNEVPFFLGTSESVRLAYKHTINSNYEGGIRFVEFEVDDGKLKAYYRDRPSFSFDNADVFEAVLAEGVDRVEFQYADWSPNDDLQWLEEWDPLADEMNIRREIPLAIYINIFWKDSSRDSWLRRTSGSGQFERFGSWRPAAGGDGMEGSPR